jgi:hypothetical protein
MTMALESFNSFVKGEIAGWAALAKTRNIELES